MTNDKKPAQSLLTKLPEEFKTKVLARQAGLQQWLNSNTLPHLLYQSEFLDLFPQESFWTGRENSSLNKVTIFQLRQFLIEAGFNVVGEHRNMVNNLPPEKLLEAPFHLNEIDLRTATHTILCKKKRFN